MAALANAMVLSFPNSNLIQLYILANLNLIREPKELYQIFVVFNGGITLSGLTYVNDYGLIVCW